MKILYHHRTASTDGQAVHIEEMIAALRDQGNEVRVVGPEVNDSGRMGGQVAWVHRLKKTLPRVLYELLELAYSYIAYRSLKSVAREFKPDFIYERYNLYLLSGVMLKKHLGIPLFLEVNSPLVYERSRHSGGLALTWLAKWAEGKAWREADYILPVTHVLGEIALTYGVLPERICVVPNGINEAHFSKAPPPEEAKEKLGISGKVVLGFTGFVRDWHGVDRVIRWMATPRAPSNGFLLVVGDGPAREELESLASSLHISDRVRFTGVVERTDVPAYVAAFDIALQPAVTAYASPLKLMEYLALGKAIIAPCEPNLSEILTDDENALLFDARDPQAFESALSHLCNDFCLRTRLSLNAKKTIDLKSLTWKANAIKVVCLAKNRRVECASFSKKGTN